MMTDVCLLSLSLPIISLIAISADIFFVSASWLVLITSVNDSESDITSQTLYKRARDKSRAL